MPCPLISVVMPVREVHAFTQTAIDSLLDQTHHNLELLLIGQPLQNVPDKLKQSDPRIQWITRQQAGIVNALNTGLASANGDYIARMDDDDISHPDRLSAQLEHLQNHQLDLCGAKIEFFSTDGSVGEGNKRYAQWLNKLSHPDDIRRSIFIESPLPHPTFFAPRQTWQRLVAYRDQPWAEDYDFLLRAWQLGMTMGKPEPILLQWREHADRLTYQDPRYSRQAFINAKANTLCDHTSGFDLSNKVVWIAGTGRNARYWFDALAEHQVDVAGFVDLQRDNMKTSKRHRPIISYDDFWKTKTPKTFLIIALGNPEARNACQSWCKQADMHAMHDFIAA